MVQLVLGDKGKGKTKFLLDGANNAVQEANGDIIYLDKSAKHMFELNNHIRLVNVSDYPISNNDQFLGYIAGILSQNHDIEKMYIDNFMYLSKLESEKDKLSDTIASLNNISQMFDVDMILGIAAEKEDLSEELQKQITVIL